VERNDGARVDFAGTQTNAAPIATVWAFLMDPNRVGPCMPGFQSAEVVDDRTFKARVGIGMAAIKATFNLDVTMIELTPPAYARVTAHGVAPVSAVDVESVMDLSAARNDTTTMQWSAHVVVNETLASLGARLMNGATQKMTAQFFNRLQEKLESPPA
jgi:carbon monoxide dehydrogenase subunit G